jgi:hypothetical protein
VLFNIHARLVSLDQKTGAEIFLSDLGDASDVRDARTEAAKEVKAEEVRYHTDSDLLGRPGGVLGLS